MSIRTVLASLALCVLPAVSFASCPYHEQAQSCAPGTSWDTAQSACVPQTSS
ncbi:hypothetical protein [Pseudodonghicola xiamenensis]|uniref:hypothetical protein n=1 Tax=Pseudodonghicola xiamenensis TaxID=337702 RepID=UPI0004277A84|nr:hypothetical protein [Pseudodonghicola xiamenensis]